jgi:hypothetical protein
MIAILILLRSLLGSLFKSRARITAENLLLRHQLNIARRRGPKRAHLSNWDRWGLVWVYRIVPDALNAVSLVRPETVMRETGMISSPPLTLSGISTRSLGVLAPFGAKRATRVFQKGPVDTRHSPGQGGDQGCQSTRCRDLVAEEKKRSTPGHQDNSVPICRSCATPSGSRQPSKRPNCRTTLRP